MDEPSNAPSAGKAPPPPAPPVDWADDPKSLQILTAELSSLVSTRGLAYNEAFTRAGMFLTFLSMSFVGIALLAQAMGFSRDFLLVTAVVLAFDLIVGLLSVRRIGGTGADDLRVLQGMNRIRHAYIQIAPHLAPYFTSSTHDDVESVLGHYGDTGGESTLSQIGYGLSTSLGLAALTTALVAGLLGGIVTLLFGGSNLLALGVAALATIALFGLQARWVFVAAGRAQAALTVRFPAPPDRGASGADS